jgi:RNA polymerase sigma factor (sigma-70 family)
MNEPHELDPFDRLAEIIMRIAESDEGALEKLYDLTSRLIFASILRIVCSVPLAEEVTLDTYLQVWRQARRYDAKRANPTTWLFMIARTRAIDAVRASKRHVSEALDDAVLIGRSESPEEALLTKSWQLKLHSAMESSGPARSYRNGVLPGHDAPGNC